MRPFIYLLAIGIMLLLPSCREQTGKMKIVQTTSDTIASLPEISGKTRKNQDSIDRVNLGKVLQEALTITEQNKNSPRFEKSYEKTLPDSSFNVVVEIISDYFFTRRFPHLMIRRKTPGAVYIDIFSRENPQLAKVLSHEQWSLTYLGDTVRDINGDQLKDFVVNWYGSTGCCLKAFSNVFLQRPDKKSFSNPFEFINPTFSPGEKIIRGVCYGHPGETELYKYKWNGEAVDTLEYVYFEKNDKHEKTGKIIISGARPFDEQHKILRRLNSVPNEYRKIEGYDWFIGNLK